ncbi:hypothetical protein Ancab_004511 [Ancistrocladus abbreviatus]
MFLLRATEEISGANIFKHMVVYNVDSKGKVIESSKSGTRRISAGNNDPVLASAEAEDVISEFQSPINDVLRQPEEEDNGEATTLMATDRAVGQLRTVSTKYADGDKEQAMGIYPINDKINIFPEEAVGGELKNGFRNMDLSVSEQIAAGWASLGNLHNQANASEAPSGDIAVSSIQNQKQNINHSKGHDIHKSEGCQSFSKVFKRQKAIKAKGSSSASKQSPVDNPSTQPDLERQSKSEEIVGITTSDTSSSQHTDSGPLGFPEQRRQSGGANFLNFFFLCFWDGGDSCSQGVGASSILAEFAGFGLLWFV